jgi:hypothetical protein
MGGISTTTTFPPPWELVWMCRKPGMLAPMEALTRLLAAAAADQFKGLTAIVTVRVGGGLELTMWSSGLFTAPISIAAIDGTVFAPKAFYRIFVVNPATPNDLPTALAGIRFDRIVYLTDGPVGAVPPALLPRLKPGAVSPTDPSQTYFSCFVPSIVLAGPAPGPPREGIPPLGPLLRDIVRDLFAFVPVPIRGLLGIAPEPEGFRSEPLDEDFGMVAGGITARPGSPVRRDSCRLRLDLAEIGERWDDAQSTSTIDCFHATAFAASPACERTAQRWARALTNRRMGLAVSGGGATSYRLVPLAEQLETTGVPVDVLGGVSGGAAFGAYYCRDGRLGLTRYQGAGNALSIAGALLAGLTSQPIESGMDWTFRDTTLDDLEVRFVAGTTALPPSGAPEPHAVVGGTLGAAVRASGALPLFFARTVKHEVVYADGAMTAQIPARCLPNYGADYIIACNAIPGPDRRNPLGGWPGGEFLYRFTYVGPLVDMFVANGFLLHRIGRDAGLYAHVFVEMAPNNASVTEIFRWDRAARLVDEARHDPRLLAAVAKCLKCWQEVSKDPP